MAGPYQAEDLGQLLHALLQPTALIELGVIAGCLAVAWLVVRLARGPQARRGSIWFGRGVVDGLRLPDLSSAIHQFRSPADPAETLQLQLPALEIATRRLRGSRDPIIHFAIAACAS